MTRSKKAQTFTYTGGLDSVEIHCPTHTLIVGNGETVEVCAEDAAALATHPDFTAGGAPAPADPDPQEVEA